MSEAPASEPRPPVRPASASILDVRGLTRRFGGLLAVNAVDLAVPRGGILALIGPNGAGKSTIVNMLSGALKPSAGEIALDGTPIAGLSPHAIAEAGLVRTFQNGRLFKDLSVLENVLAAMPHRRQPAVLSCLLRLPSFARTERAQRDQAHALLAQLGLGQEAGRRIGELSYGQQRKVELARALMLEPKLLLLDEPAAGLNSGEVRALIAFVDGLRGAGMSILLIEHNMGLVMRLADRITVLNFGRRIADGTPADIAGDEDVIEAYLGRKARHAPVS